MVHRLLLTFRLNDYFALTSQASLHGGESVRDARNAAVGSCCAGQGRDLHAKYAARKFQDVNPYFLTSG